MDREEDLGHVNGYHPMGMAKMTAGLGRTECRSRSGFASRATMRSKARRLIEYGNTKARLAHQLLRGFHLFPYGVPNLRVEVNTMKTFVPSATWRSTGTYANVFYLESFVEEMARAAGRDPIEYRRALISAAGSGSFEDDAKADWLKTLDLVAEKAGWGRQLPKGTGIGFAIDDRKSVAPRGIALVAMGVTVSVSPSGSVTIERMDIVHDRAMRSSIRRLPERQIRGQ